jgi:hypothetical protein
VASETTTANPELIQTQVASLLVQPLEAASVVLASGVRIFDTAGPLRIPKLTAGASVGFVAELAAICSRPQKSCKTAVRHVCRGAEPGAARSG